MNAIKETVQPQTYTLKLVPEQASMINPQHVISKYGITLILVRSGHLMTSDHIAEFNTFLQRFDNVIDRGWIRSLDKSEEDKLIEELKEGDSSARTNKKGVCYRINVDSMDETWKVRIQYFSNAVTTLLIYDRGEFTVRKTHGESHVGSISIYEYPNPACEIVQQKRDNTTTSILVQDKEEAIAIINSLSRFVEACN